MRSPSTKFQQEKAGEALDFILSALILFSDIRLYEKENLWVIPNTVVLKEPERPMIQKL
jgi:hypothetical protein